MGEINISRDEQAALEKVNQAALDKLIERSVYNGRAEDFYGLSQCGAYVANKLQTFERELRNYGTAKSFPKQLQAKERAQQAGYRLSSAVMEMKHQLEIEKKQRELFYVDDQIIPPSTFGKRLTVTVGYQWRAAAGDSWNYGHIRFYHEPPLRPLYGAPTPKRKPSAAQQAQKLQAELYDTWEHLMRGALYSVQQYLEDGGDGGAIPKEYTATYDTHSGCLNNYSTDFWRK